MSKTLLVIDNFASIYTGELKQGFPTLRVEAATSPEGSTVPLEEVEVLVTFGNTLMDDFYRKARRLEWVQSLATGVDQFLRNPSFRAETLLTSARGMHAAPMRETVAFLMLAISRGAGRLVRDKDAKRWDRGTPWPIISGKTAVIVGTGVSGTGIAQLLKGFGMWTIGISHTPRPVDGFDEMAPAASLAETVKQADYLINVLPGGPANAGAISRAVIGAMKPTAYFINVGRGETVDEDALIAALSAGRIAGAGLDVVRTSPLPQDSPLWTLSNVFLSPHIGGFFAEYEEHVMPILLHNVEAFLAKRIDKMKNVIPHHGRYGT